METMTDTPTNEPSPFLEGDKLEIGRLKGLLAWAMEELIPRMELGEEDYEAGLIPFHSCGFDDCTCSFGMNYIDAVLAAFANTPFEGRRASQPIEAGEGE